LSAAPAFGLAVFGVVETLAYFSGFLQEATIALVALAAVSLVLFVVKLKDRAWLIVLIGYGLLVAVVCLAPSWVGGMKFAIYQGNPSDQFNYISLASAVGSQSYQAVRNAGAESDATFIRGAAATLAARPTVGIVLASFRSWFYPTTAEAAYPFLALLQTISAFGALFVFRNIFGTGKLLGLLLATAFAIGFFVQYVIDINAWSSLSSLSFAPIAAALVYLITKGHGIRCVGPLTIILTGILYFYPESSIACVTVCSAVFVGGVVFSKERLKPLIYCVLAAGIAITACLPVWNSTAGFLIAQAAGSHKLPWAWFIAFDSFYFGDLVPPDNDWTAYRVFSTPIDVVAGLLGLYFVAPSAALPTSVKVIWKLAEAAIFISLAVTIARSIRTKQSAIFLTGCLAALLLPAALLFRGDYWTAGKAVTMVAPLLFLVLAYPLTQHIRALAIPAAIFVALHLGFGIQRIAAATNETGMRAGTGYPSVPHLKALYDWTVPSWRSDLAGCTHVAVDVKDAHLERLVETVLNDLNVAADFKTDRKADYYGGPDVPAKTHPGIADCGISDHPLTTARDGLDDHRELRLSLREGRLAQGGANKALIRSNWRSRELSYDRVSDRSQPAENPAAAGR
jgi:hypothetical protein